MIDINKKVINYCNTVRKQVMGWYKVNGKKPKRNDYPAAVVVCTDNSGLYSCGGSNHVTANYYNTTPTLKNKLNSLGHIGDYSKLCANKIGACAEPHAARNMIKKHSCKLGNLFFSFTRRPRTMEKIRPCKNSRNTFPNL